MLIILKINLNEGFKIILHYGNMIKLHWTIHPDRDEDWRFEQDKLLGPSMAAQECDCDFITSGQMVIDGRILEEYKTDHVRDPIERRGVDSNVWVWEPANYSKDYIVCADVARGDATDYSAFHILEMETLNQVASSKETRVYATSIGWR